MNLDQLKGKSGKDFIVACAKERENIGNNVRVQQPRQMAYNPEQMLPEGWTWASLSETCERVSVGHVGPTTEHFCSSDVGVALVRSQNVRPGRLDIHDCAYITKDFHSSLRKSQIRPGDILVVRVGANRGDVAVVPSSVPPLNCANIIFARPLLDTGFFQFYLRSDSGRDALLALTTGAAQGVINTEAVAQLPVPVPPVQVQRRIASILSAYDDLIENNTRRIAVLEEMARRIYEEWFVQFRFPGREKINNTEDLPLGWKRESLRDAAHLVMGLSPKSEFYNQTGDGLPFHQGVTDFGDFFPTDRLYCTHATRLAKNGDILFSVRAPVGRINLSIKEIIIGRGVAAIRCKRGCQVFLLSQLRSIFEEEDIMGNGAIFKAVTKKDMETVQLLLPPTSIVSSFEKVVAPMWHLIRKLTDKNANLRAQRDLLLPKLISGEIDVSSLPLPGADDEAA